MMGRRDNSGSASNWITISSAWGYIMHCPSRFSLYVLPFLAAGVALAQKPQGFCEQQIGRCVDLPKAYTYDKPYVGHDEPSLLFYSNKPGSGNSNVYFLRLPKDSPTLPKQNGTGGTFNAQLHVTFWLGMAVCDTESFPEYTSKCTPDSDSNIFDSPDANSPDYIGHHPGTAFVEMQFYPPGFVLWPPGGSCDATRWCAALNIDSLGFDPNNDLDNNDACLSTVGEETVNFAFITKSGKPHAPANPVDSTLETITPNPKTDLFMNSGDILEVQMYDTSRGLKVVIKDLTTHERGPWWRVPRILSARSNSIPTGLGAKTFPMISIRCTAPLVSALEFRGQPILTTSPSRTRSATSNTVVPSMPKAATVPSLERMMMTIIVSPPARPHVSR